MQIALEAIESRSKEYLEHMFQFYIYDMSEFAGWALASDGRFQYNSSLLTPYWKRDDHSPYFIVADGEIAGFSLVRNYPEDTSILDMGQFFILRKFRNIGLGKTAFQQTVAAHRGRWQVRVLLKNINALAFWKSSVLAVSKDGFVQTRQLDGSTEMHFLTFDV